MNTFLHNEFKTSELSPWPAWTVSIDDMDAKISHNKQLKGPRPHILHNYALNIYFLKSKNFWSALYDIKQLTLNP